MCKQHSGRDPMKVLRLRLFQETACYKKPAAFKVGETFPLPPYSTVKGMIHHALQADEYIPMAISIQGKYESKLVDYQRHYFVKSHKYGEFPLVLDGLALNYDFREMTTMPIYMHMLLNVELVVHLHADEGILAKIHDVFHHQNPPLSLGRWEDLVRVDECSYVDCKPVDDDQETVLPIYIPTAKADDVSGVPYRLNWRYEIREGVRQWERIKVRYIPAGEWIGHLDLMVDRDGYPIAFPAEMEE